METRWKLHCEVVEVHEPIQNIPIAGKVEEKEELKKLVKVGEMVDGEIFADQKKIEKANSNS